MEEDLIRTHPFLNRPSTSSRSKPLVSWRRSWTKTTPANANPEYKKNAPLLLMICVKVRKVIEIPRLKIQFVAVLIPWPNPR